MQEQLLTEKESRFEFRTFGQDLVNAGKRMARLSAPLPEAMWERSTEEWYLTSKYNYEHNIKIRADQLEVKKLLQKVNGLEQWKPIISEAFPVPAFYISLIFELSGVETPLPEHRSYEADELLKLLQDHEHLQLTEVRKQRSAYQVNSTICETATVLINGAKLYSVSSEGTKVEDVLNTIAAIELGGAENINYIEAIKRVTGINLKKFIN
jgi:hypothetical protein